MDWAGDAMEFATGELGVDRTVVCDVQDCAEHLPPNGFDIILVRHVIEHLRDPERFLDQLRTLLSPAGLVQIETPNVGSPEQWAHPGVIRANQEVLRRSNPTMSSWAAWRLALGKSTSGINPPKHLWIHRIRAASAGSARGNDPPVHDGRAEWPPGLRPPLLRPPPRTDSLSTRAWTCYGSKWHRRRSLVRARILWSWPDLASGVTWLGEVTFPSCTCYPGPGITRFRESEPHCLHGRLHNGTRR